MKSRRIMLMVEVESNLSIKATVDTLKKTGAVLGEIVQVSANVIKPDQPSPKEPADDSHCG